MNQIERFEGNNYTRCLWSDAMYDVDTSQIKRLLSLVAQQLDFYSQIDARFYQIDRRWQVRFCWQSEALGRQSFEQIFDASQLACVNAIFLEGIAHNISNNIIRSIASDDSQNWVIVRHREGFLAGIHQAGKTSVNLILREMRHGEDSPWSLSREFEQHRNLADPYPRVTIEAFNAGNVIVRGGNIEVNGMLLQGELLEWLRIGEEGWFRFSPNTTRVNVSDTLSEQRITFTTRPRTNRLASFERMRQMIEQGQVEIPRSGYFDQFLVNSLLLDEIPHLERSRQELPTEEHVIIGMDFARAEIHVDDEDDLLEAAFGVKIIGDTTCKYNAKSKMLRCAVNPCGPCEGCQHYEEI